MPEDGVGWMGSQKDLLTVDDIEAVARSAASLGVTHLKLTGGEPTLRKDIIEIIERLHAIPGIQDISLTTNAFFLDRLAKPLKMAGIDRITLSCDSLVPDRFKQITRGGDIAKFWTGVEAAEKANFSRIKMNVVLMKGFNDDEIVEFARIAHDRPWTVRFIEYMPLGESALTGIDPDDTIVENKHVMQTIEDEFGQMKPVKPGTEMGMGPALVYKFPGAAGRVGFISAMSQPFCESCNRLRLTAVGELRSCLFDGGEVNMLPALRPTPDMDRLNAMFQECVVQKPETHSGRGNRAMSQIGG